MRNYKIPEIKRTLSTLLFVISMCVGIIFFSKNVAKGVENAIIFCTNVLIPSLFPFMVISAFTVNSGICSLFEKPLDKITRLLFNLSGNCGTTIFLSIIGGFPIGARSISSLYKKGLITKKQGAQMAYFCVSSGPGFLITFVGSSLYGSVHIGLILFGASVLSVIILGIVIGLFSKKEEKLQKFKNKPIKNTIDFTTALTKSTLDGAKGIIEMCSMVIIFCVFISLGEAFVKNELLQSCFVVLMEVTTACNRLWVWLSLPVLAFSIGFGGLCVHFQIFQALGEIKIKKALFFLCRIIQGLLMAVFTKMGLYLFPITEQVFSNTQNATAVVSSSTYLGSIMLILTAVCFIYSIKSKEKKIGG